MEEATTALRWLRRLQRLPGHQLLFVAGLALAAPYSATIRPRLVSVDHCRMTLAMRHRRAVSNHLRTVHAAAMANLAELTGSLCVVASIPATARWIPNALELRYLRKARGDLQARCVFTPPDWQRQQDLSIPIELTDAEGECVATARLGVRIGPKPHPR